MKIGSTKRILINFASSILTDLNDASVVSLEAYLFVDRRKLLAFKKGAGAGFDGDIVPSVGSPNVGIIQLTEALSNRLVPGDLKIEVWLKKTVGGVTEVYDFTLDVAKVEAAVK